MADLVRMFGLLFVSHGEISAESAHFTLNHTQLNNSVRDDCLSHLFVNYCRIRIPPSGFAL